MSIFLFYTKSLKEMYHLGEEPKDTDDDKKTLAAASKSLGAISGHNSIEPASPEFLKIHNAKLILNALSPFLFVLMDSFMGIGIVAFIGVGLGNSFLRKKMNAAGGRLSPEAKKASFLKQTIPMLTLSVAVMAFFYFATEFIRVKLIILPVIAIYTVIICLAAYWEYIHDSDVNC